MRTPPQGGHIQDVRTWDSECRACGECEFVNIADNPQKEIKMKHIGYTTVSNFCHRCNEYPYSVHEKGTTTFYQCVHCGHEYQEEKQTMHIINLTPHEIRIKCVGDAQEAEIMNGVIGPGTLDFNHPIWVVIPPSGTVARVAQNREFQQPVGYIQIVSRSTFGAVENLPAPQPDTIYIVSGLVLARVESRPDVFAPGEAVRDDKGNVIGCLGLSAANL